MSVLVFSTIMSEIVLIIRRVILKIILINVQTSLYKVHVILVIFQYILNFLDRISKSKNVEIYATWSAHIPFVACGTGTRPVFQVQAQFHMIFACK
jgi:hypothetical protein